MNGCFDAKVKGATNKTDFLKNIMSVFDSSIDDYVRPDYGIITDKKFHLSQMHKNFLKRAAPVIND